ncbi:hypothetical protein JXA56_04765 [Candidatus Micrarchaeota archaeon]|nr:hypothetical protein [Candidatus Micrarchaeota archaeon]
MRRKNALNKINLAERPNIEAVISVFTYAKPLEEKLKKKVVTAVEKQMQKQHPPKIRDAVLSELKKL